MNPHRTRCQGSFFSSLLTLLILLTLLHYVYTYTSYAHIYSFTVEDIDGETYEEIPLASATLDEKENEGSSDSNLDSSPPSSSSSLVLSVASIEEERINVGMGDTVEVNFRASRSSQSTTQGRRSILFQVQSVLSPHRS